jgi:hypothetical protein
MLPYGVMGKTKQTSSPEIKATISDTKFSSMHLENLFRFFFLCMFQVKITLSLFFIKHHDIKKHETVEL